MMPYAKYVNLALLILGFGLGQGSLFLSNTYLLWAGHYSLVAAFGAANALLTFLYFIVDWGGLVYLAKESVMTRAEHRPLVVSYLALSLTRVAVALVFYLGLLLLQMNQPATFLSEYNAFAGLGLMVSAFNVSGLLDGRSKAGISGLTQALPIVAAAMALPVCVPLDAATAGRVLGGVYTLGLVLGTGLQLRAARIDWREARAGLSWRTVVTVGRESVPYMLTPLPGHALFRGQVLLATTYLPPHLVALFIYARQIIGVGYQGLGFFLRVDLKDFADHLTRAMPGAGAILLKSTTVRLGLAGTIGVAGVALALRSLQPDLAATLLTYSPCIAASATASTLQRAYLLRARGGENVAILVTSALISLLVVSPFIGTPAIWPLVAIELASQTLQSLIFAARWGRSLADTR